MDMMCENCNEREATVHVRILPAGGMSKKILHLCRECASKKGVIGAKDAALDLTEVLKKLAAEALGVEQAEETAAPSAPTKCCARCGTTATDFEANRRLGCPSCYDVFKEELGPVLKAVQKSSKHCGSSPFAEEDSLAGPDREGEMADLRRELARAVAAEAYERAALLRDRIRDLVD